MKKVLVNLGCGNVTPDGWLNFDGSLVAKYKLITKFFPKYRWANNVTYLELTKTWPIQSNSVDAIYFSHTLEHLGYSSHVSVFAEAYRVLKENGVFRIVVPDFHILFKNYLKDYGNEPLAIKKLYDYLLIQEIKPPSNLLQSLEYWFKWKNNHNSFIDYEYLAHLLKSSKFASYEVKSYLESVIPEISAIEIQERFVNALCMEAKK